MSRRPVYIFCLVYCIAVYELPCLLTLAHTGWQPLPPVLVADQMLYLNLSAIRHISPTEVLNPWYGIRVLVVDVPHLMFPVTFLLFRWIHSIAGSWTAAMLIWNALWAALTYAASLFLLDSVLPDANRTSKQLAAAALFVLQSPLIYLAHLKDLPSLRGFLEIQLPYLRFAIPQVILPAVLAYWALQVRTLKNPSNVTLGLMAALQFAVCIAFPYLLPLVAISTGIALFIAKRRPQETAFNWPTAFGFAALCAGLDLSYVLLVGFFNSHANVHFALQFRPEMILPGVRPYMVLLVIGAALVLFSSASVAAKATVAGLALANALFGFANVFFSPEAQMQQHPYYIMGITTWLPFLVFLWPVVEKIQARQSKYILVTGLFLIGAWEGFASSHLMLPMNKFQAATIRQLSQQALTADDVVVAPSRFSDDISSWIPLLFSSRVLYTSDGENILSAGETESEQSPRQAMYLMLTGVDSPSFTHLTEVTSPDRAVSGLLRQTDRTYAESPLPKDRLRLRLILRQRLLPLITELSGSASDRRKLLGAYKRIVVIDSRDHPSFPEDALSRWILIQNRYQDDQIKLYIGVPKLDDEREASHVDIVEPGNAAKRDTQIP